MSERRRKPREAESRSGQGDTAPPRGRRRSPRPLDSAGRPAGSGPDAPAFQSRSAEPNGAGSAGDRGGGFGEGPEPARDAFEERSSGSREADAAADWERLRRGGSAGAHGAATPPPGSPPSLAPLLVLLEALRGMVPGELERQFSALLREALLTLRALIDWYLERLDGSRDERRVEDIPID